MKSCFSTRVFCEFCKNFNTFFKEPLLVTVFWRLFSMIFCQIMWEMLLLHFMSFVGQSFVGVCFRQLILWQGLITEAAHPEKFIGKDFLKSIHTWSILLVRCKFVRCKFWVDISVSLILSVIECMFLLPWMKSFWTNDSRALDSIQQFASVRGA